VSKKTGLMTNLKHLSLPSDDPKQRQPDIALAHKILKWEPKVSLKDGLDKTIAYFKTVLERTTL
jgi:UDP-glucuronate decarboxylase